MENSCQPCPVVISSAPLGTGLRPIINTRPRQHSRAGSTLVEMVITVGLLVSVMLPLVGMLSIGMDTSLKAGINTIGSRITGQLLGQMQQAAWKDLDAFDKALLYFDDQGLQVTSAGDIQSAAFIAKIELSTQGITLTTQGDTKKNKMQRKVITVISSTKGLHSEQRLTEALVALQQGKPAPPNVRVGHGLITNTGKVKDKDKDI